MTPWGHDYYIQPEKNDSFRFFLFNKKKRTSVRQTLRERMCLVCRFNIKKKKNRVHTRTRAGCFFLITEHFTTFNHHRSILGAILKISC